MIDRQIEAVRQGADDPVAGAKQVSTPQSRVLALERQLADARMVYTDKHPEVMRLQQELKEARAAAAAARTQPPSDRLASLQADPVYRQLLSDQEEGRLRVRELQRAESQGRQAIAEYQARVEAAPLVEQQLASLEREYNLQKSAYADLVSRRQSAALTEDLERRRAGERFKVFEPADLPQEPYKPNRQRILLMALVAGICLGGISLVGREFLDPSVYDAQTLQQQYELPVLGEVSHIEAA